MTDEPPCPITGKPGNRRVQWVSADLLADLWRWEFRVDVRPSFQGITRFGLWQSPTGLYFFDPMLPGDAQFYAGLYRTIGARRPPRTNSYRGDCNLAAGHVKDGDRVLDVGCGFGAFRRVVPQAHYVGLDPHFAGEIGQDWVRAETLGEHLKQNAGAYDVACAFQVLEHVANPVEMLRDMARAVKPGGKVIVGVPHVPSAHTRIPNFLINGPPHHLTWWTERSLAIAARHAGLREPTVEVAPWTEVDSIIYWMDRCSWAKCRDVHYRHSWSWHGATIAGFLAGYAMSKLRPVPHPARDEGAALLLVASTPAKKGVTAEPHDA
jgi:SAM-dependent methyltransferase